MFGTFVTLPIPMPRNALAWVDPGTGEPVALWCDRKRIRPADFATVLTGIEQYNRDCEEAGVPAVSEAVMEAIARERLDEEPSGDEAAPTWSREVF